jgi:hypothetical protein
MDGKKISYSFSLPRRNSPTRARAASFLRFLDYTEWHTTVGRTSLDEGSAHRRELYLTTYDTRNRQIYKPLGEFCFVFSCSLYLIRTWFVVLNVLNFAFFLYLQHNKKKISMPLAKFKPAIPKSDRPQTLALDHSTTCVDQILPTPLKYPKN